MIARHIRHYSPKVVGGSYNRRTKKPGDPSLSSTGSSNHSLRSASFRTRSSSPSTLEKKLVTITKDETKGLGITLRGGIEHGLGHFISAVEKGSVASTQGLKPGDQIVTISGLSLKGATHKEVVSLISSTRPNTTVSFNQVIPHILCKDFLGFLGSFHYELKKMSHSCLIFF